MFEIPDDDDLFNEDTLRDIFGETRPNDLQDENAAATTRAPCLTPAPLQSATMAGKAPGGEGRLPLVSEQSQGGKGDNQPCKKPRVLTLVNSQLRMPQDSSQSVTTQPACAGGRERVGVSCVRPQAPASSSLSTEESVQPDVFKLPRRRSLRKFPGPAGILPDAKPADLCSELRKGTSSTPDVLLAEEDTKPEDDAPCSQASSEVFGGRAWQALVTDLQPNAQHVLQRFSIQAMLHKAGRRLLPKGKVPLLLGVLTSMDLQGRDASVVLRDPTGQMQGSLHREVLRDFSEDLQAGAAVVLRQVSVISPSSRTHYLNITSGNIVTVYPAHARYAPHTHTATSHRASPPSPSQQKIREFVQAAEVELLEAANAARDAAVNKLRGGVGSGLPVSPELFQRDQGRQHSLFATPLQTAGGRSPSLFSTPGVQEFASPSRCLSPVVREFRPPSRVSNSGGEASPGSFTPPSNRFSFRGASSAARLRLSGSSVHSGSPTVFQTPNSAQGVRLRAPPAANFSTDSTKAQSSFSMSSNQHHAPVVASTSLSSYCTSSSAHSFFPGGSTRIQPSTCSQSSGNKMALSEETPTVSKPGATVSYRFNHPTNVNQSENGELSRQYVSATAGSSSLSQSSLTSSSQPSKWSFKRKSSEMPGMSESKMSCGQNNDATGGAVKQICLSSGGSTSSASVPPGGTAQPASSASKPVAGISSNFWDEELSDDILSQLSDDF